MPLFVRGFAHAAPVCEPQSNIDFVHYVWQYEELVPLKRYAMTILPHLDGSPDSEPSIFYLMHYSVNSDAFRTSNNCIHCAAEARRPISQYFQCLKPGKNCNCLMCRTQPPSLVPAATHALFGIALNPRNFKLTPDTAYSEYVYAFKSERVARDRLLPPTYPEVIFFFFSTLLTL